MFLKIAPLRSWRVCLIQRLNLRYFRCPAWKTKSWQKANLHENWNMQTLFWGLLNILAKFHQNWSLQFWATPFQSWCVFWDTVYMSCFPSSNRLQRRLSVDLFPSNLALYEYVTMSQHTPRSLCCPDFIKLMVPYLPSSTNCRRSFF